MQFTLHATRRTPRGVSRLVQAMPAWMVKTRRAPSGIVETRGYMVGSHDLGYAQTEYSTPPSPVRTCLHFYRECIIVFRGPTFSFSLICKFGFCIEINSVDFREWLSRLGKKTPNVVVSARYRIALATDQGSHKRANRLNRLCTVSPYLFVTSHASLSALSINHGEALRAVPNE